MTTEEEKEKQRRAKIRARCAAYAREVFRKMQREDAGFMLRQQAEWDEPEANTPSTNEGESSDQE